MRPVIRGIFALVTIHFALGQQQVPNVAGIWQFNVNVGWSAVIQINQNGTQLVGQFTPVGNLTPAFTATIVPPSAGLDLILIWNTSRTDVPSKNFNYFGGISSDGRTIQGTYGPSPSQPAGTWSATRLAGLGPAVAAVTNAASGSTGAIAPGEIVSVFSNPDTNPIGPTAGVGLQIDQNGKVVTALRGVRVHFLPIDAYSPLIFVSAGQINAIVPYEVAGLTSVKVEVQYSGQTSDPVVLQVAPTAPGVFTANGSGVGLGAILNHDGITLNGPGKPEPRGGIVVLFATGEGQTTPPGVTGEVTSMAADPPITPALSGSANQRPACFCFVRGRSSGTCRGCPTGKCANSDHDFARQRPDTSNCRR